MLNERRMKMKKNFLSIAFMAVFMLMATNSQAQSWSDLFNKDNISKVVPSGVYFTALDNKLSSSCCRRCKSLTTVSCVILLA